MVNFIVEFPLKTEKYRIRSIMPRLPHDSPAMV